MRVVKEVTLGEIRVSIFSWNSKYIFKYELGPMEQTFKVSETDILKRPSWKAFWKGSFWRKSNYDLKKWGNRFLGGYSKLKSTVNSVEARNKSQEIRLDRF